jgi:hypothetical protein
MSVALNKEKNKSNRHITLSENQICKALEEPINSLIYLVFSLQTYPQADNEA